MRFNKEDIIMRCYNNKYCIVLTLLMIMGSLHLAGCGSSGETTTSTTTNAAVASLNTLPDFSDLMATSSSSDMSQALVKYAVVGTPPAFSTIGVDDIGLYFFGTSLLDTSLASLTSDADKGDFMDDVFKGLSKCELMASSARSFSILEQATTSMCYMQRMPTSGEIGIVSGITADEQSAVFENTTASDRLIKIAISGEGEEAGFFPLIKVLGSTNLGSNNYESYLFHCGASGLTGYDHTVVNSSNELAFTSVMNMTQGSNSFSNRVVVNASLTCDANNNCSFSNDDPKIVTAKDQFNGSFTFDGSTVTQEDIFNASLVLSSTQIELMMSMRQNHDSGYFLNKIYALSNYTGTSFVDAAFPSGAMTQFMGDYDLNDVINWQPTDTDGANVAYFAIGAEYDEGATPRYVSETSSATYQSALSAGDDFASTHTSTISSTTTFDYSTITSPTDDINTVGTSILGSDLCDTTPDVSLTLNMDATANTAIATQCEPTFQYGQGSICEGAWQVIDTMPTQFAAATCPVNDLFEGSYDDCWSKSIGDYIGSATTFTANATTFDEIVNMTVENGKLKFSTILGKRSHVSLSEGDGLALLSQNFSSTVAAAAVYFSSNDANDFGEDQGIFFSGADYHYIIQWSTTQTRLGLVSIQGETLNDVTANVTDTVGRYVCITRNGDTFKAYDSTDGSTWTEKGTLANTFLSSTGTDTNVSLGLAVDADDPTNFTGYFESFAIDITSDTCPTL